MTSQEVCESVVLMLFIFYDTYKLMSDCIYGVMKAKKSVFLFSLNFRKKKLEYLTFDNFLSN